MTGDRHEHYLYRFDQIDEKLGKIDVTLDKLNNYLFVGNGKPAMQTRIAEVEKQCNQCVTIRADNKKRNMALIFMVVSASLAVLVPKLFVLFKYVIALL